ncbi:adenylyl cyclase-associated protein 2 isoform X4 [Enoplosus armatus]|uniref:adenylyl cyclase-associated protein 2 isoform X4 n=1 Tax=Enoplosus armatus TaxID=215367 RepID=UPI0039921B53
MEGLMERLERAVTRLEKMSVTTQAPSGMANGGCVNGIDGGLSQCVEAFDVILKGPVSDYLNNSRAIGGEVEKHAEMVNSALQTQRAFLKMAATHQEPAQGPIAPPLFDPPTVPSAPCPPPPPPPPGPPPVFPDDDSQPQAGSAAAQHSMLFAQLNQGMEITKGLKHVSENQKTHKNPNLRSQATPTKTKSPAAANSPRAAVQKRPPLLELEGKKWRVENFEQKHDLLIEETELKQVVYVFSCNNSTLQIKGKINSIILDDCKKLGLVFENVVGIVEIINSKAIQLQVLGKVPTISINKTEGCQVYLSKDSLNCDIVSAKSSEMNILVPQEDDEYREFPVPEQFKTVWDGSKLVTEPTEIAG